MDEERLLTRDAGRRFAVKHLEIVDTVKRLASEHRGFALLTATTENHWLPG
jgi:hypothetical protein